MAKTVNAATASNAPATEAEFMLQCQNAAVSFAKDAEAGDKAKGRAIQGLASLVMRMAEHPSRFTIGRGKTERVALFNVASLRTIEADADSAKDAKRGILGFLFAAGTTAGLPEHQARTNASLALDLAHVLCRAEYGPEAFDAKAHCFVMKSLAHLIVLPDGAKDAERIGHSSVRNKPLALDRSEVSYQYLDKDGTVKTAKVMSSVEQVKRALNSSRQRRKPTPGGTVANNGAAATPAKLSDVLQRATRDAGADDYKARFTGETREGWKALAHTVWLNPDLAALFLAEREAVAKSQAAAKAVDEGKAA